MFIILKLSGGDIIIDENLPVFFQKIKSILPVKEFSVEFLL